MTMLKELVVGHKSMASAYRAILPLPTPEPDQDVTSLSSKV